LPWYKEYKWTRLPVGKQIDINVLATLSGVDANYLRAANAELLYAVTPRDESYLLKVKEEDVDAITKALSSNEVLAAPVKLSGVTYTVKAGDTLWSISRMFNTSVQALAEANGLSQNGVLRIGIQLRTP
jgi:LysM repeat protein